MNRKHSLCIFVVVLAVALLVAASTVLAHSANSSRAAEPNTPFSTADLSLIAQASSDLVEVGQLLTFTFSIANHGPATATDVKLVDRFYADVAFAAWAASGACVYRQREFSCSLGSLSINQTTIVTLTVRPRQSGKLFSHIVLSSDEDDPTPLDNLAWFESGVSAKLGPAFMVKDINPQTYSNTLDVSDPQQLTPVGDLLFFTREQAEAQTHELWVTDNSMRGADCLITYTRFSNENVVELYGFTKAANTLFFLTENSDHITCLWRSDGTSRGTQSVGGDCATVDAEIVDAEILATVDNWLYFTYVDYGSSPSRCMLDKIDGARSNSVPVSVAQISSGDFSCPTVRGATNVNGTLFFFVAGQLWKSDGTQAGTVLVKDLASGLSSFSITAYAEFNRYLFFAFSANGGTTGGELWRSDGTEAGTVIIKDTNPSGNAFVRNMFSAGGSLFFEAQYEWWKSDGTYTGTVKMAPSEPLPCRNALDTACNYHGVDYKVWNYGSYGTELWKWSSALTGTLVKDINPGIDGSFPDELVIFQDLIVFSADDGENGRQLWISDGTGSGTRPMFTFAWPDSSDPQRLTDVNGTLFFDADDGIHGPGLWKSAGTAVGTALVKAMSDPPRWLINFRDTLFFVSRNGDDDALWSSDGTEAGTVIVKTWHNHGIAYPAVVSGTLFFVVNAGTQIELWRSDGTPDGTQFVREFPFQYDYNLADLTAVGSTLFFTADDNDIHGRELWKSDGTFTGTVMVQDLTPGAYASSTPRDLTRYNDRLYFTAHDPALDTWALWQSDGTAAGTLVVKSFAAIEGKPKGLYVVGSTLFFLTNYGNRRYLWTSGGSLYNTWMIQDLGVSPSWSGYTYAQVDGLLYLNLGGRLWTSVGTPSSTRLVADDLGLEYPVSADGLLYFMSGSCGSSPFGGELWKSDGTPEGTLMIQDVNPGRANASPVYLTRSGISDTVLLFNADDGRHGKELWGQAVAACTWVGLYGDDPQNPRNWTSCNGGIPWPYDSISIPPSHDYPLYGVSTPAQANDVTVRVAATVSAKPTSALRAAQAGVFTITGDLHNNGAFTDTTGTIVFDGPRHVIGGNGPTTFNDLVISARASLVIQAANPPTVTGVISNYGTLVQTRDVTASTTTRFMNLTDANGAGKYWGVEITPSNGALGVTQVRVSGHQACVAFDGVQEISASQSVQRCYELVPTSPQTATVRFYYSPDEANGNSVPVAFGWNGAAWQPLTSTHGGSGEALYVEASNVSGYSLFMLKDAAPERKVYLPLVIK